MIRIVEPPYHYYLAYCDRQGEDNNGVPYIHPSDTKATVFNDQELLVDDGFTQVIAFRTKYVLPTMVSWAFVLNHVVRRPTVI